MNADELMTGPQLQEPLFPPSVTGRLRDAHAAATVTSRARLLAWRELELD